MPFAATTPVTAALSAKGQRDTGSEFNLYKKKRDNSSPVCTRLPWTKKKTDLRQTMALGHAQKMISCTRNKCVCVCV